MKRKILALLLVVVLSIAVLSSCAELKDALAGTPLEGLFPHEHTFSEEWSKDATNHWHEATCEHTDEVSDKAAHSYVDGVCVCGAEAPAPHEHAFSDEWSKSETHHWHAAICEHSGYKKDQAEHVFVDGECICGAHKHSYTSAVTAPTCTEAGFTTYTCKCGDSYTADETAALGHTEEAIPASPATCTATGLTAGVKCSVCGEILTAQTEIPALGHTAETIPGNAATCTDAGLTDGVKCSVCGETLTAQTVIPALGHSYGDDTICDVCGAEAAPDGSKANPFIAILPGSITVNYDGGDDVWYAFTAGTSGKLVFTLGNNVAMGYLVGDEVVYTDNGATELTLEVVEGETYKICFGTADFSVAEFTVTAAYLDNSAEYNRVIYAGNNMVMFSPAEIEAGTATRKLVITAASTYSFKGDLFVSSIVDAEGNAMPYVNYAYELPVGEYTVTFGMFSIFGTEADVDIALNVEDQNAGGDDDDDDPIVGESDLVIGENTVVIEESEITTGKFLTFVAYEAGTYTFASSDLLAIIQNADGMQIGRYQVYLEAGTYTVILFNVAETAGTYTVDVSFVPAAGGSTEPDGTQDNPFEITLPSDIQVEYPGKGLIYYTFTSTEEGILNIEFAHNDAWAADFYDSWAMVIIGYDQQSFWEKASGSFEIPANSTVVVAIGTWSENGTALTMDVSIDFTAQKLAAEGDFTKPISIWAGETYTFDYTEGAADKFVWYTFNPWVSGPATITLNEGTTIKYGLDPENLTVVADTASVVFDVVEGANYYIAIQPTNLQDTTTSLLVDVAEAGGALAGSTWADAIEAWVGDNFGTATAAWENVYFKYEAWVTGTLTFSNIPEGVYVEFGTVLDGTDIVENGSVVNVVEGNIYKIVVYGALIDVSFSISFEVSEGGDPVGPEIPEGDYIQVEVTDTYSWIDEYSFTAPAAGKYTFTVPAGLGFTTLANYENYLAPEVDYYDNANGTDVSFELAEGDVLTFRVGAINKGTYYISYTAEVAEEPADNVITVVTTDAYGFFDEYTFVADAEGKYTFVIPAGLGIWSAGSHQPELDFQLEQNGGVVTFELEAGESLVYQVGAFTKDTWTITYTFEACEVENDEPVDPVVYFKDANGLGGEYTFTFIVEFQLTFKAAFEGADYGTLTVVDPVTAANSGDFAYTIVDGKYVFEGEVPSVIITNDGTSWFFQNPSLKMPQAFAEYGSQGEEPADISGTYTGTDDWGNALLTVVIDSANGTVVFNYAHPMFGTSTVSATYDIVDGAMVLYGEDGEVLNPLAGAVTLENGVPVAASYNGNDYTLAIGGSTEPDPEEPADISGTYTGTDDWGNALLTVVIDSANGTVVFNYAHPMFGTSTVSATYDIVDGAMVLYGEDGEVLNPLAGAVTLENGVPVAASYNGNDYTLAIGGSTEPDPEPDPEPEIPEEVTVTVGENTVTVTQYDLDNWAKQVTFVVTEYAYYEFSLYLDIFDVEGNYISSRMLAPGEYILSINVDSWMNYVGEELALTITATAIADLTPDLVMSIFENSGISYEGDGFSILFGYDYDNMCYRAIVADPDWLSIAYYLLSGVKNDDGSFAYSFAFVPVDEYVDDAFALNGAILNVAYVDGSWILDLVADVEPPHEHAYNAVVTAPTCVTAGIITYTCECGDSYTEAGEPATGIHTWVEDTNADDTITKYCSYCTYVVEEIDGVIVNTHGSKNGSLNTTTDEEGNELWVSADYDGGNGLHVNVAWPSPIVPDSENNNYVTTYSRIRLAKGYTVTITYEGGTFDTLYWYCDQTYSDNPKGPGARSAKKLYDEVVAGTFASKLGINATSVSFVNGDHTVLKPTELVPGYVKIELAEPVSELVFTTASGDYYVSNFKVDAEKTYDAGVNHPHTFGEGVVTAPTCTEAGYTTYTCSVCGESCVADEVAALGHSYDEVVTEPTCSTAGFTTYTCSVCGYSYVGNETETLDHTYDAVVTPPTTSEPGYTTFTCSVCGYSYVGDEVPALGHDYVAVVTAPTCTEKGFTTYTCSECGDTYVGDEVAALGHSYDAVVTAPTCVTAGFTTHTCSVCGDSYTEAGDPATGIHNWVEDENAEDNILAACPDCSLVKMTATTTANANDRVEFDADHAKFGDENVSIEVLLNGSSNAIYDVATKAPMTLLANQKLVFTAGGKITTMVWKMPGYQEAIDSGTSNNYTKALTSLKKAAAGETLFAGYDIASYSFSTYTNDKGAFAGTALTVEFATPVDSFEFVLNTRYYIATFEVEYITEAAHEHSYEAVVTPATCTAGGYTTYTCECGDTYTADETEALGHAWVDATYDAPKTCSVCGATDGDALVAYAAIGDVKYGTLADAIAAAVAGDKVTLLENIVLAESIVIANGQEIVLDLNGKVLSMEDSSAKSACLLANNGTLTIVDSGVDGKITFNSTTPDASFGYATNAINNAGTLVIEGGIIENTTNGGASYAIDTVWYTSDVSITVKGGYIVSAKTAIRQTLYTDAQSIVNIEGGEIVGNYGVQIFNHTGSSKPATLNITGGTITGSYAIVTSYGHADAHADTVINISGGTVNGYTYIYNGQVGSTVGFENVAISGGSFNGYVYVYIKDAAGEAVYNDAITGGSFNYEPWSVAAGYHTSTPDENLIYTVVACAFTDVEEVAGSCLVDGYTKYTCACGQFYYDNYVAAPGHTEIPVDGKDATCEEAGYTASSYCEVCGETIIAADPIEAIGHNYIEDVTKPTCTTNGYSTFECDKCFHSYEGNVVEAIGHNYSEDVIAATCTKDGYTEHACANCGDVYNTDTVPALGHADENADYKCDRCSTKMLPEAGESLTIPEALAIAKLQSHNTYTTQKYYITGIVTNVYNTQYGNLYLKDADGNQICIYGLYSADGKTRYDAMSYKPVEGDELTVYTVLGMYNSTAQGKNAWADEIVAHEHDYKDVVTAATCTNGGYTIHSCTICGTEVKDSEVEALGHTTDAGTCERCGQEIGGDAPVVKDSVTFEFGSNGNASHVDGNSIGSSKTYTEGTATLKLTGMANVYGPAFDAKGNSCIKLGASSKAGSGTITVDADVTSVVIKVAKYKANTTKITINGTTYTLTKNSNDGAYDEIEIDTTASKTITFTTVSGGYRAMINSITYNYD